ncbi:hypothetical protein LR48_Vigan11g085300 [Vigna angularis]|uniref:Uncharacterized protein n=2 Tax=Phaseolus angularis TaxID=3914 RepID=A0A0L9VRX2_PHAAN|nr:hypothetical protein LR48_Vigan11g085300 [Vigna angularis]BAT72849.1 hypothetical protein VIGAN_01029100 [Vigna angularis var. angularis]
METTQNFDCTVLNNNNNNKSFSFLPSQPPFHVPSAPKEQQHSSQMSDSDSCSEDAGDAPHEEEELSLDEFLNDGNAKKKIELLAAMVGVNTTEPAIVLTEVVRALKLFNHYYKQF